MRLNDDQGGGRTEEEVDCCRGFNENVEEECQVEERHLETDNKAVVGLLAKF